MTELGWSTLNIFPVGPGDLDRPGSPDHGRHAHVKAGIVDELHDDIGGDPADRESPLGLMNQDYTAEPAYLLAFSTVMSTPAAPSLAQPTDGGVVNGSKPTLTFSAAPNSTVAVSLDGTPPAPPPPTVPATPSSPSPSRFPTVATRSPRSTPTPTAGSSVPPRLPSSVIVEPAAPQLTSPRAGAATGSQPTFSFTADPGVTVAVSLDGTLLGTTTADASGVASLTAPRAIDYGSHSVSAVARESIGCGSPTPPPRRFVVPAPSPTLHRARPDDHRPPPGRRLRPHGLHPGQGPGEATWPPCASQARPALRLQDRPPGSGHPVDDPPLGQAPAP